MLRRDQKLFGYALNDEEWIEFDSWELMDKSEVEYRIWKDRYEKQIHVSRDLNSNLVFFNRGHRSFSYYSNSDDRQNVTSGPVSLSHVLRQKIISEMKEANFSLKNIIHKGNYVKKECNIKFKKIYIDERIEIDGNQYIPDIIIEFDEPADLALKWEHKVFIEIVEYNETTGEKIEAYRKLNHGVIEIPYTEAFDIFETKHFFDISRNDIYGLVKKISNFYKKSIWANLIVDSTSENYLKIEKESVLAKENKKLLEEYDIIKIDNKDLREKIELLENNLRKQNEMVNMLMNENRTLRNQNKSVNDKVFKYEKAIEDWSKKSFIYKILNSLKLN